MLKNIHFQQTINGAKLDAYLAMGWYRIGQVIFTTDHIPHPGGWWRVFWLRFPLHKIHLGSKQRKLMAVNKQFDVSIHPFALTGELESLYQTYLSQLDFEPSPTLRNNLFDYSILEDSDHSVFDSALIEIRDKGKLIGAGVFDQGTNSIAGIINFFDPAYKKYSLGKWLMLLKIRYAIENRMQFYYPGYIACDYKKFDYKLFPDTAAAEIYDPVSRQWLAYNADLMQQLKDHPPAPLQEV